MIDHRSDARLVGRVLAGDPWAAGTLYDRHWRTAWRAAVAVLGSAADAEDVATEAWLRAIDALDECLPRENFGPWLRRIAVNRAIDVLRRRRFVTPLDEAAEVAGSFAPASPDDEIRQAVARLPVERREVAGDEVGRGGEHMQRCQAVRELPVDGLRQRARGVECPLLDDDALALIGIADQQGAGRHRRHHARHHQKNKLSSNRQSVASVFGPRRCVLRQIK